MIPDHIAKRYRLRRAERQLAALAVEAGNDFVVLRGGRKPLTLHRATDEALAELRERAPHFFISEWLGTPPEGVLLRADVIPQSRNPK